MKKVVSLCAAGAVTCALALGAVGCGGADEKYRLYSDPMLTIEASALDDMVDISDMLFGLFLEDINYASYALDDNLVANGNFEALGDRPNANNFGQNWRAYGGGTMSIGSEDGLFADHEAYHNDELETDVNPHYAVVSVSTAGGGIINEGYKQIPIAMQKGAKYKFSAFIKSPKKSAEMTVKVDDGTKSYLEETIQLSKSNEWIKYERTVEGLDTGTKGLVLKLSFDTAGEYLVDAVSLETTDSTVGIKNYIYNAIKDMTPKFMRFPGGCIIEGDAGNGGADTKEIYDWKNSVGAVQTGRNAGDDTIPAFTYQLNTDGATKEVTTYGEWATRTNNYDLWGYNMDYGLGFYDYFLLCESIGASPVPIVNCGYSDQGGAANVNSGNRDDAVNQWDVDMMYYTNTDLLLSPNYYVQKLFMNHSGTHYLPADYTVQNGYLNEFTADGLKQDAVYQAITYDEASGDVIVKIVNAGAEDVEINVDLADTAVEGVADVTVITGKYDALSVNRLKDNGYEVLPQDFTLGVKSQFGYLAPKCSVTAIRLHTK